MPFCRLEAVSSGADVAYGLLHTLRFLSGCIRAITFHCSVSSVLKQQSLSVVKMDDFEFNIKLVGRLAQSVQRLTTGWTVRDRILWTRVSARPDRPWGPPSFLSKGTGSFPGVKCGWGVLLTTQPF